MSSTIIRNYDPESPINQYPKKTFFCPNLDYMTKAATLAEEWAKTLYYDLKDDETRDIVSDFYKATLRIVVLNCFRVFVHRSSRDSEEAQSQKTTLAYIISPELTEEKLNTVILKAVDELYSQWSEDKSPRYFREVAKGLLRITNATSMRCALLTVDPDRPYESMDEAWAGNIQQTLALYQEPSTIELIMIDSVHSYAEHLLEDEIKPAEVPMDTLRTLAGIWWIENDSVELFEQNEAVTDILALVDPIGSNHLLTFSNMPFQAIDRATRGSSGWKVSPDVAPVFTDVNNGHAITYFDEGLTQEALREGIMRLNPRTADVWRLCTAAVLEAWKKGEKEAPRVWIDVRQLCDAMGFAKHPKGGHTPRNIAVAAQALVDLERLHITVPLGETHYPLNPSTGKRKKAVVEAREEVKVLMVSSKRQARKISEGDWVTLEWLVTTGEWIRNYPREQFAPLFRALVELSATYTPDLWAKALGTELIWQYRIDKGAVKTQRVETMLKQAYVLEDARGMRNKKLVRDYFEKAMDNLQECGVCQSWEYASGEIDQVEATTRG